MDPIAGFDIRLLFTDRPETVHCSTEDVYTSEITFLALHPWRQVILVQYDLT